MKKPYGRDAWEPREAGAARLSGSTKALGMMLGRRAAATLCAGALALSLAGCASGVGEGGGTSGEDVSGAPGQPTEQVSDGFADVENMDFSYSDRDKDASWDKATATVIELGAEETVSITQAGSYVLTGELADGQVVVNAPDAEVQLVLAGATIHNEDGPAVEVKDAGKVYVTLADGSVNVLSDGKDYALAEGEDEPNATLFSKADLCINGSGALSVEGAHEHAINSKDALVITGGQLDVVAADDALRGKDCVKIADGTFHIEAGGDGIKSNNDEDYAKGFVSIDGGTFAIDAVDDAVKAFTYYMVRGGEMSIAAGDDAFNSDSDGAIEGGVLSVDAGGDAFHTEFYLSVDSGTVDVISCEEGFEGQKVYVNGGTTHITSLDDAINAATGEMPESDDATAEQAAAEGVAAASVDATAPDGLAAGDEAAASEEALAQDGAAGAPGALDANSVAADDPMAKANEDCLIQINGGYLALDAGGDAIDSNGYVEINGGIVLAEGPTATDDATFDYDFGAKLTGGTVLMLSNSHMEMGFTEATQPFGMVQVSGKAGDTVAVVAQAGDMAEYGELLASYTAKRDFVTVTVSSPAMTDGIGYEVVVGAEVPDANEDGFADGGTPTGGVAMAFTASTEASGFGGMGSMGAAGAPGGMMPGGQGGAKPDGQGGMAPGGTPPEPPAGATPAGTPPEPPAGAAPDGAPAGALPERMQDAAVPV